MATMPGLPLVFTQSDFEDRSIDCHDGNLPEDGSLYGIETRSETHQDPTRVVHKVCSGARDQTHAWQAYAQTHAWAHTLACAQLCVQAHACQASARVRAEASA